MHTKDKYKHPQFGGEQNRDVTHVEAETFGPELVAVLPWSYVKFWIRIKRRLKRASCAAVDQSGDIKKLMKIRGEQARNKDYAATESKTT